MLFLALVGSVVALPQGYVRVPDGMYLHESCIFNHPNGLIDETVEYTCKYPPVLAPQEQVYRMDTHLGDSTTRQTAFNASFIAPTLPPHAGGQVVYFWPGFKQTQPEMGYPVFQPVLQYGQHGSFWELQSWFVWGNKGIAHTGPLVPVSAGDNLVTYMVTDPKTNLWTCSAVNSRTQKSSVLTQTPSQMAGTSYFEYAMLVLETISVDTCNELPAGKSVEFTAVSVNGQKAQWTPRVTRTTCGEAIATTSDTVTMSWHN